MPTLPLFFEEPQSEISTFSGMAPIFLAVFLGFLAVSVPLGALSLELSDTMGFGTFIVGLVIGLQSAATLLTRHQAGTLCDRKGSRQAILVGLSLAACSGVAYILASVLPIGVAGQLSLIVAGRLLVGIGESLFLTGLMSLGIARLGITRTGKVMSWTGIAIYAALGLGGPLGLTVQASYRFVGVGLITCLAPMFALFVVARLPSTPAAGGERVPFYRVISLIWRPGLVLALSMVPFSVLVAFLPLYYVARGWPQAGTALSGFASAYILVRLVAPGLPDRYGATRVAIGSLVFELAGQALLWLAPTPTFALIGAILTGLGFSLIFPTMGVLATRSVPPDQRGRAVGNFMAFADIALGITGPAVGLATQWAGISSAFVVGVIAIGTALALLPSIRLKVVS